MVTAALHSQAWYRVADLRPQLRSTVAVQRQLHRDQLWFQLADDASGRRHRVNEAAYRLIGSLDGERTVGAVWDAQVAQLGDAALTQDDAMRVLGQLSNAGLLQCELTPDVEQLFRQYRQQTRRRRWMELNPLAMRVSVFNPAQLLVRFEPWLKTIFHPLMLVLWLLVVLPALLLAVHHWPELSAFAGAHIDTPRYLLIGWFVYPLIKAVHELGHALAVRRWGGDVKDVGFTLFVLVPAPYVDASAASAFSSRWQRAAVSAIGILIEVFIAALALFVWLNVQDGWVRDVSFVVMLIGAVSTVLLNGNPLLRFDGYHVLCDVFDLPNLDTRSRAWWGSVIQRRVLGVNVPAQPLAPGERKWMFAYAPLAMTYRLYIGVQVALWIGLKSVLLGFLAAAAVVVMTLVMPVVRLVGGITRGVQGAQRQRSLRRVWVVSAALLLVIAALPLPYGATTPAVVWLPDHAEVRAQTEGFVREVQVRDGDAVQPGQVLARLDDPELFAKQAEAQSRLAALRVQYFNVMQADRVQAQNFSEALTHAETEAAHYDARIAQLEIRSAAAGRMVMTRQHDIPGTFLKRGQALGYVFAPGELMVRAVVTDDDAALVRSRARGAAVWLEGEPGKPLRGEVRRDVPAASFKLPNAALADNNGGAIATDPADNEHLRTLQPIYTVDVGLPEQAGGGKNQSGRTERAERTERTERIGGRAWVRFDFGYEPLAFQWAHALGQLLLKHFGKVA